MPKIFKRTKAVLASTVCQESVSAELANTFTETTSHDMQRAAHLLRVGFRNSGTGHGLKWRESVLII